jgi:uncharacterized protein YbjT (DUF2867 family)
MDRKKITIIGGTGLIGAKLARLLALAGHEVVAASPGTGVNSVTGLGLDEALAGADILVDVSNAMSFDPAEVRDFFDASGRNLTRAAAAAGVGHHVVLSIVGADRMPGNGYFDGKLVQERIAAGSGLPYTIVRSTSFSNSWLPSPMATLPTAWSGWPGLSSSRLPPTMSPKSSPLSLSNRR